MFQFVLLNSHIIVMCGLNKFSQILNWCILVEEIFLRVIKFMEFNIGV